MSKKTKIKSIVLLFLLILIIFNVSAVYAQPEFPIQLPESKEDMATSLQIVFLLTILSLAPAILIMMTSFTRIIITLSFLRNALGTQQMPPNQILIGLALFLTFFIMAPIGSKINDEAIQPYLKEEIEQDIAIDNAINPLRDFMLDNTRGKDIDLFVSLSG